MEQMIEEITTVEWQTCKLKDVGDIVSGGTPSTAVAEYWDGDIPWITPADLSGYNQKQIFRGRKSITAKGLKNSSARLMPKGSVLFSSRAPIGYVAIAANEVATNQGFKSIIPKENVDPEYLYYALKHSKQKAEDAASGTTFKEISLKKFAELEIPLPDFETQRQIVSQLEELFSELNKGIEELKTAQQQLKVYRQAVLKWAFEGKLTNEHVKDGELPEGWTYTTLGNIIEQPKYGTSKKCSYNQIGKGVLRIPNVKAGAVDDSDLKYAEFDNQEVEAYRLKEGDLLTIRSNGSVDIVGQCALITKKSVDYLYAGYLIRLRPLPRIINPRYLLHVFATNSVRTQIEAKAKSTSGVNNINSDELKSLIVPICSIEEQLQIVQEIESRLSVCDKIEETINDSLKQAEALKQSILKDAFIGK